MSEKSTRDQIIQAADQLFYRQGFDHTSFADIAQAVEISRGNFYFHFKTKDEILAAVIEHRLAKTRRMLDTWEADGAPPEECIGRFIGILTTNGDKIMRFGCPVGTLCSELAKLGHPAQGDANRLFTLFREWLRRQFERLGRKADADLLAMHLLARSQGVATLASAFRDGEYLRQEVAEMRRWLDEILEDKVPAARRK
jgi:TetR/AcrR family transcriptional regulator, transcriptional repressor for nem operon